ncbi:MAG: ABC transporter ATP-binding protein [Treponema sp.]|jgi:ABC-type multidrug transport system ATPase subunit|nr:ABC transporter ATP-binding protein [Treponema sp.]
MIICEHLTKLFDANSGIKDINLQFSPGIIYGIIGYNGSGKTTLLNCIEGLYIPTSGFVFHDNVKTTENKDFLPYRRKIAFLPSDDFLYPRLTCMENIELSTILRTGKNKLSHETDELIRYFEIESFLHKKFGDCSTGMKKKVQIVVSLIGEIDTIIWDEPNDGLDIISNLKIKTLLKHYKSKKNITILFSSHVIEFLNDFVDHCVLLHEGNIIENTDIQNIGTLEKLFLNNLPHDVLSINI